MDIQSHSSIESGHAGQKVETSEEEQPHIQTEAELRIQASMGTTSDQHVDTKPIATHVDATVEHFEEAPHPAEGTAKILGHDRAVPAAAGRRGDISPRSLFLGLFGAKMPTTSPAPSENVEKVPASVDAKDVNPGSPISDHDASQTQGKSDLPSSEPSVLDTERTDASSLYRTAPTSFSEAAKSLLATSDTPDARQSSTLPSGTSQEKGKAKESPTLEPTIRNPASIQKSTSRPAFFGESDSDLEQEARAWLSSSLNPSAPVQTPSTSDTWHRTPAVRNKPSQRKMSYSTGAALTGSSSLNVATVNSPVRATPSSTRPDTREAPPRSAFALTAAALKSASTSGVNGFSGTHHARDREPDFDASDSDRWGVTPVHIDQHERELDRRSREIDRRERELDRRERELERRMRDFDSERARRSTEVRNAPAWSEALATLATQIDARFIEERKKAEEREMKWARLIQRGLLVRVQEAIEKERRLYGVPERMSDQEVNELLESSVGWLMQSDEDIADRVRFQSLLHLAQERLAMEAGLQPAPGSSSLSMAWRLALGPSVITELRYNKAMELLQARANSSTVANDTSKSEEDRQSESGSPPSNPSGAGPPLDSLTLNVMANKAAMEYVVAFTSPLRKEGAEMLGDHAFAPGRILRRDYMESVKRQADKGAVDATALELLVDFICPESS